MDTSVKIRKSIIAFSEKYFSGIGGGNNLPACLTYGQQMAGRHTHSTTNFIYKTVNIKHIIQKTRYVIVGGVATRYYMPERFTIDMDILILPENTEQLHMELKEAGYEKASLLAIGGSTWNNKKGGVIDVIELEEEWVEEAVQHPNFFDKNLPVIALPYLVLMKLKSGRVQDIADISRMLGLADDGTINKVKEVIKRYLPSASEDLKSLVTLGKLEWRK